MFAPSRRLSTALTAAALLVSYAVAAVATSAPAAAAGTVTVAVQGQGSVTGPGIDCNQSGGPDCSEAYSDIQVCDPDVKPPCHNEAPEVQLTAGPDANGFVFDGFTSGCASTSGRSCWVTVAASTNVTAHFHDAQLPTVTLTSPGNGSLESGNVLLSAAASDNAAVGRVEFLVRGSSVGSDSTAPYSVNFDTSTVADGPADVVARAIDSAGNSSPSSQRTITIDNTAPGITGLTGPANQAFGTGSTQSWTWSASDATSGLASVECAVVLESSAPAFAPCSGGAGNHSVTGLAGGGYTFTVRATDNANHVTAVTRHFSIDATPPDTSLTSGPTSLVTTRTISFGFSATEPGSTFECRLYPAGTAGAAFVPCTGATTHTASGLGDGSYRFEVRGIDAVGNVDASPAAREFTVDATPPTVSFSQQPNRVVKTRRKGAKASFSFSSEAGASFRCSLDGAAYTACPATLTLKVKAGRHTLSVEAVDAVGNVSAPATAAWKVKRVRHHR